MGGSLNHDLKFLDNVKLDIKPEIIKSIRFSESEINLLKFPLYKGKKNFGAYIKDLIAADIKEYCDHLQQQQRDKQQQEQRKPNREELKEILIEILKDRNIFELAAVDPKIKDIEKDIKSTPAADAETLAALADIGFGID